MVAEICAAMTLGRLSFCVAHDVATMMSDDWARAAVVFYAAAIGAPGATAIGLGLPPICAIDLVRRRAWRALGAMHFLYSFAAYLGTDALQFLRTPVESAQGDYVAVARSFALSHAVEALAAIAVLVLLRSDLAEERRRLKRA